MAYFIQIVDRETGESQVDHWDMPWHEHSFFFFAEGNGSCDCNRARPFGIETECNCAVNRYVIVRAVTDGGVIITDDAVELNPYNDPAEMIRLRDATAMPAAGL